VPLVVRRLLDGGLLDPDAMTVTGQTIGEAARDATETPGQAKLGTGTRRKHRKAIA
jgi:dihydroxy-acid dehydratase